MEYALIPSDISSLGFYSLVLISCFTSMLTASIGMGGGTLLLAIMAQIIPVKAIIPVHGLVQFGSNFGRAAILLPKVDLQLTTWFLLGSLIGALIGGQIVVTLPVIILKVVLGAFILFSVWGPNIAGLVGSIASLFGGGFISTLLTMFIGATGPFVIAILRPFQLSPPALVATSAACLVIQHLLKVLVFGYLGFLFAPYLALIVLMILTGLTGTFIGTRFLLKVDEKKFKRWLNIVLTVLAIRLIVTAFL